MSEINTSIETLSTQSFPWHQKCWEHFTKAKSSQHLPHAILLTGEDGIAKYALAKRMAKSLLCINSYNQADDACNQCQSCKTFESGANPDFTEIGLIEDKQQIGVDQIRVLSDFLNYSRSYNAFRVVVINPVERMNLNAANSLLKSLEEPTPNTVLILVTSKISQLLPTIKSRCQSFSVSSPARVESFEWLKQNMDVENQYSLVQIEEFLTVFGNKPLKVLNLNREDLEDRNKFFQDMLSVTREHMTITEMAKKWEKYNLDVIVDWQILLIQNSIKSLLCSPDLSDSRSRVSENQSGKGLFNNLTKHLSMDKHWNLYQSLLKQKQLTHTSVNSLMFVENMILLWK